MNSYSLLPTSSGRPQLALNAGGWINGLRNRWNSSSPVARICSTVAAGVLLSLLLLYAFSGINPPGPAYPDRRLPSDFDIHRPSLGPPSQDELVWQQRAEQVKAAFVRGYSAYERIAYPHDELRPLTNGTKDELNVWAATMVDGIDTMILMGLYEFSNKSVAHVARMKFNEAPKVQFFETVIRYVGGLLSAYALTGEAVFLARADDLGQALLPIFDSPISLPFFRINLRTGRGENGWMGDVAILAEMASCQMEYRYLAHLTGRLEYIEHADYITSFLRQHEEREGLFALTFAMADGQPRGDTFSVGARADSAYEYLLKQWLMTGKTEQNLLDMYLRSASAIIENMLYVSPRRKLLYVTDINRFSLAPVGDFQHLSCFIAGVFSLGVAMIPDVDPRHAWVAEGLAHTCWITYADSVTGLAPEVVIFKGDSVGRKWVDELRDWGNHGKVGTPPGVRDASPVTPGQNTEYELSDKQWLLRPETIESFYILWRTTGDSKWRERGWEIFEAIEKHARVADAYTSLQDVSQTPPILKDELPSFFFAETLKYAYLLFIKEDIVPLDKWTFNTEAHPFPVFTWSAWEKEDFHIS